MRSPLRYYGSPQQSPAWIVRHFPTHPQTYIEPFGGSASALFHKRRSPVEIYNDLDSHLFNFFKVARNRPNDLIAVLRLTAYCRSEYDECFAKLNAGFCHDDPVEWARQFFVALWQSIGGSSSRAAKANRSKNSLFYAAVEHLSFVADRLMFVRIEQMEAIDLIERHLHDADTLIYVDPPTVANSTYHIDLAARLVDAKGYVVISGAPSDINETLYREAGWQSITREQNNRNPLCLWLNPRTASYLNSYHQLFMEI